MSEKSIAINEEVAGVSDIGDFWRLLKPNVMSLVVFTAGVGLYLAPGTIHPLLAVIAILCVTVAAGAAAAINNAYDADIDRIMARTRRRPTAAGRIQPADALAYGLTLSVFSIMVMGLAVNWTAAALIALTIAFYVLVYTMWLKRRTPQNIVIGGAAGALPPMIGWAAVTGDVSLTSVALFAIIFFWTPPHFWALALFRAKDYENVGVPMLPVTAGPAATRLQILIYTVLLLPVSLLPVLVGSSGLFYGVIAGVLGSGFLLHALRLWQDGTQRSATKTFRFSILYLFGLFGALAADRLLTSSLAVWRDDGHGRADTRSAPPPAAKEHRPRRRSASPGGAVLRDHHGQAQRQRRMTSKSGKKLITAFGAFGVILAMVGLTAASVPLYRLFCQVTGYGGTTQVAQEVVPGAVDRMIRVRFDAGIGDELPWRFQPVQREIEIPIGEETLAFYRAANLSDRPIVGSSTFNVTPHKAGPYFSKIACFCFTEQVLQPGEAVDMPVSFFVDPAILEDDNTRDLTTITLSYTFFMLEDETEKLVEGPAGERPAS